MQGDTTWALPAKHICCQVHLQQGMSTSYLFSFLRKVALQETLAAASALGRGAALHTGKSEALMCCWTPWCARPTCGRIDALLIWAAMRAASVPIHWARKRLDSSHAVVKPLMHDSPPNPQACHTDHIQCVHRALDPAACHHEWSGSQTCCTGVPAAGLHDAHWTSAMHSTQHDSISCLHAIAGCIVDLSHAQHDSKPARSPTAGCSSDASPSP